MATEAWKARANGPGPPRWRKLSAAGARQWRPPGRKWRPTCRPLAAAISDPAAPTKNAFIRAVERNEERARGDKPM
jgi:hypothetical protein